MTLEAIVETVRKGDPDRFLSVMASPPALRADLFVLYAFNIEVARAPWASNEEMIAEMRLQFWRDVVDAIDDERAAHQHELVAPLRQVIGDHDLPVERFRQIIEARRWDIYKDAFADAAGFDRHIDHTAGNLMWLAARCVGAPDTASAAVRDYAYGAGVANWLVAVPELAARGRIPLLDGRETALAKLASAAYARMQRADKRMLRQGAAAVRAGWLARGILRRVIQHPEHVATGQLMPAEFTRRGSLLIKSMTGRW